MQTSSINIVDGILDRIWSTSKPTKMYFWRSFFDLIQKEVAHLVVHVWSLPKGPAFCVWGVLGHGRVEGSSLRRFETEQEVEKWRETTYSSWVGPATPFPQVTLTWSFHLSQGKVRKTVYNFPRPLMLVWGQNNQVLMIQGSKRIAKLFQELNQLS